MDILDFKINFTKHYSYSFGLLRAIFTLFYQMILEQLLESSVAL